MSRLLVFWRSTVGKKAVMSATGLIMILFLIFHLAANLLVFYGPSAINAFASSLDARMVLLVAARVVLLAAVGLHVAAAIQLAALDHSARPIRYEKLRPQVATLSGRTIRWSGVLLGLFIVFHVLHLATGMVRPAPFQAENVYENVVGSFRVGWVAALYLVAMSALGLHLYHGYWASFRTLGVSRLSSAPLRRPFAIILTLTLWLGFGSIPIAALIGILRLP